MKPIKHRDKLKPHSSRHNKFVKSVWRRHKRRMKLNSKGYTISPELKRYWAKHD